MDSHPNISEKLCQKIRKNYRKYIVKTYVKHTETNRIKINNYKVLKKILLYFGHRKSSALPPITICLFPIFSAVILICWD